MTLRVLYLTDSLSDLDGVGRYAVELVSAIEGRRADLDARFLLARKHRPTSARAHWPVDVVLPPDYFFHMSRARFWPSLAAASMRVAIAARDADLVHAIKDYPHSLAGLIGARIARKPCVATAHGTYSVQPLLDPRHRSLARWCYRRMDAFVAVSRYTARRMLEVAGPDVLSPERVHVIPNAVGADVLARATSATSATASPITSRGRYTLTIGELKERKGHHVALAAFVRVAAKHADLHHVIIGKDGDDEYARSLRKLVADAGLERRVRFAGNVSEEEKLELVRGATVFLHVPVHSSDGGFEGFGIVYLEAAALGVPSVGALGCGAEDAIDDGVTGFLVEPEPVATAAALERLLGDDALRSRMGAAGRERAARATWAENAHRVLEVYERVLARR